MSVDRTRIAALAFALAALSPGLSGGRAEAGKPKAAAQPNTLSAAEKKAGWRLLFDGQSTIGWRGYKQQDVPTGWMVQDGELRRVAKAGDLVTVAEFGDFELVLDYKIEPGGNSGVMYRVAETEKYPYETGPEFQIIDDEFVFPGETAKQPPLQATGALYGFWPAAPGKRVNPPGQWNTARIVVRGTKVEHWLNGKKLLSGDMGTAEFAAMVAASKFRNKKDFAKLARGHIALQDHDGDLAFRNIKVRELGARPPK